MTRPTRPSRLALAALLAAASPAFGSVARADTVYFGREVTTALKYDGKVTGIEKSAGGPELAFTLNGRPTRKPLAEIAQIQVDGQPALNAAEQAYAAADWDAAVDSYEKAARAASGTASADWVRRFVAGRQLDAATRAGRFDAAARAYVALVDADPAAAAAGKPDLPRGKSAFLDTAVDDVRKAADRATEPAKKQALLSFLLDLQTARGDDAAAADSLQALVKSAGAAGSAADDPARRSLLQQVRLGEAKVALDAGKPDEAIAAIRDHQDVFTDADAQSEALYLLARADRAKAGTDRAALEDAALAYMRVVAHFGGAGGRDGKSGGQPRAADALLAVADIHEQIGEPRTADALYRQVAAEYPGTPAAATAEKNLRGP